MDDSSVWSVDRLAAQNLLSGLPLEDVPAELLEAAAEHFARHRYASYEWAAQRAHAHVTETLEAVSVAQFAGKSEEWRDGFCFAEQQLFRMMPEELLELGPDTARSKGQVLRSLVRQARKTTKQGGKEL